MGKQSRKRKEQIAPRTGTALGLQIRPIVISAVIAASITALLFFAAGPNGGKEGATTPPKPSHATGELIDSMLRIP